MFPASASQDAVSRARRPRTSIGLSSYWFIDRPVCSMHTQSGHHAIWRVMYPDASKVDARSVAADIHPARAQSRVAARHVRLFVVESGGCPACSRSRRMRAWTSPMRFAGEATSRKAHGRMIGNTQDRWGLRATRRAASEAAASPETSVRDRSFRRALRKKRSGPIEARLSEPEAK